MRYRRERRRGRVIPALFICFVAGGVLGWWARSRVPTPEAGPRSPAAASIRAGATSPPVVDRAVRSLVDPGVSRKPSTFPSEPHPLLALRSRSLRLPIDGAGVDAMKGQFDNARGESRRHEAVDLLAPRRTPVRAVEDGTIAKLFLSKAGGTTIYQFDPGRRFCYYYAHLQEYASGLHEGQHVSAGEVMGYVGTTGNAPLDTPHLHFAIFELNEDQRWWEGRPIDPYLVYAGG